ncbi:hypothetical protein A2627_01960 [Candidatus Woesebacteria bacterium RIFCSPHIGHO2_01_FULL_39_28]|uniref:EF-hand domain-containing protein n=1 Tax=Candidatus Woesebacteria bacterium RIFCSPHIGHO2_01_FULL_39_28 TaxID=1802496 RepID=A0A1F7YKS2_9BACT|nr:MAG: hypothetical protein A2627_01960 [Candidatus Woesebacteria bacterium RIFCSPHIGHO2_01_FULL_39_28]OGM56769.1 MAG: hypothetical protein A3A50_04155 [Candidatus Woesebacteria bacterium RIFCSPLOWO2_01_FULL_38_20]
MSKCITWIIILGFLFNLSISPVKAQVTYAAYIWESMWVTQNSTPSQNEQDVRNELISEVTKFLDWVNQTNPPKPPGPFYLAQGYQSEDFYWLNPGETVLVLSQTLDFLPQNVRDRVIAYLKYIMTTSNVSPLSFNISANTRHTLLDKNNYRSFYTSLPSELAPGEIQSSVNPVPENLYAVWAFANNVSQYESSISTPKAWDIVNSNWPAVDALYRQAPMTSTIYWDIMAQIGYARMAKKLNKTAPVTYSTAESRANSGYTAGTDFISFYKNTSNSRFCWGNTGIQNWVGIWDYCLFSAIGPNYLFDTSNYFRHDDVNGFAGQWETNKISMFAPEIGRFFHDKIQNTVINDAGYGINRFLATGGTYYDPFWWESKGDKTFGLRDANTAPEGNSENAIMHPSFSWQMFLLKAYVEGAGVDKTRADEMKKYLDTPWALGDNFHIEKLVTLLRMYSTVQWAEVDPRTSTPVVSPPPAVNIKQLISNWLTSTLDQNSDGKVNSVDFAKILLR